MEYGMTLDDARVLVVAPHPDDEVLGAGGTMARVSSRGGEVHVLVMTRGFPPHFHESVSVTGREEARRAHEILGVQATRFLDFPAANLDQVPKRDLNQAIGEVVSDLRPAVVFLPFVGDIHLDHQRIFEAGLVACRPHLDHAPGMILAYETLSETNWNAPYLSPGFQPNFFVDIGDHLEVKCRAMEAFESQVQAPPHERSLEVIRALATLRGGTVQRRAAEAFVTVRCLV